MYEFLDLQGERVTVRSVRTLSVLLGEGQITAETRFRRAGEADFGAAASHPELRALAVQLGIVLAQASVGEPAAPVRIDMGSKRPRRPARLAGSVLLPDTASQVLTAPDKPVSVPATEAQAPPSPIAPAPVPPGPVTPAPFVPLRAAHDGRPSSRSVAPRPTLKALELKLGPFWTVLVSLVVSAVVGLIISALGGATRDGARLAWPVMMIAGGGIAWLAGRRFRTWRTFSWRREGPALALFGASFLLLGDQMAMVFAAVVAFGFTKAARSQR